MCTSRARRVTLSWALCVMSLGGCTSDEWPPLEAGAGASTGDLDDLFEGARLEILEPASPSIHPLGTPVGLQARLVDIDGLAVPLGELDSMGGVEVVWVHDAAPLLETLEGDVELPAGVYELSAVARLPNGDRLQSAVGGVHVQARWTGEYLGDVTLAIEAALPGGGPLNLLCEGALRMQVSLDGNTVEVEDGTCSINAFGTAVNGEYAIDVQVFDAGLARGTVDFAFDSPFGDFALPIEWAGAFYDDRFSAGLSGTLDLPFIGSGVVDGSLQGRLVDPYGALDEG